MEVETFITERALEVTRSLPRINYITSSVLKVLLKMEALPADALEDLNRELQKQLDVHCEHLYQCTLMDEYGFPVTEDSSRALFVIDCKRTLQ